MSIDVNNESGTDIDEQAVLDVARYALARMRIHPLSELSVIVVDAEAMEELDVQWMDLPGPTDVMSFPRDELRPPAKDDEEPPHGLEYAPESGHRRRRSRTRLVLWITAPLLAAFLYFWVPRLIRDYRLLALQDRCMDCRLLSRAGHLMEAKSRLSAG